MRNKFLVGGIIAVLVILFFGARSAIHIANGFTLNKSIAIEDEKLINDSYEKINISSENAKVQLVPTTSEETKVEYGGMKKSKVKFDVKVKGDTLSIRLNEKGWNFIRFSRKELTLIVHLPEKTYQEIEAQTVNGIIQAEHLQANKILLATNNGLVKLENSAGNQVEVHTDNGQISLNDVKADITAQTKNGRIIYNANEINHQVSLNTNNGSIAVKLSEKPANAKIDAQTDNGFVKIFESRDKSVIFGEGEHLLKLRTNNGKISVEE